MRRSVGDPEDPRQTVNCTTPVPDPWSGKTRPLHRSSDAQSSSQDDDTPDASGQERDPSRRSGYYHHNPKLTSPGTYNPVVLKPSPIPNL